LDWSEILPHKLDYYVQLSQQVWLNLDIECNSYITLNWTARLCEDTFHPLERWGVKQEGNVISVGSPIVIELWSKWTLDSHMLCKGTRILLLKVSVTGGAQALSLGMTMITILSIASVSWNHYLQKKTMHWFKVTHFGPNWLVSFQVQMYWSFSTCKYMICQVSKKILTKFEVHMIFFIFQWGTMREIGDVSIVQCPN